MIYRVVSQASVFAIPSYTDPRGFGSWTPAYCYTS